MKAGLGVGFAQNACGARQQAQKNARATPAQRKKVQTHHHARAQLSAPCALLAARLLAAAPAARSCRAAAPAAPAARSCRAAAPAARSCRAAALAARSCRALAARRLQPHGRCGEREAAALDWVGGVACRRGGGGAGGEERGPSCSGPRGAARWPGTLGVWRPSRVRVIRAHPTADECNARPTVCTSPRLPQKAAHPRR
jgi:hypothetical protein